MDIQGWITLATAILGLAAAAGAAFAVARYAGYKALREEVGQLRTDLAWEREECDRRTAKLELELAVLRSALIKELVAEIVRALKQ